ncbi:MAG: chorismate synthase [Caldithrix sp.]|nr:chorismate synthase [Caldithrix sp.]
MRYLTSGESHGQALSAIIEGLPANLAVDIQSVNHELSRRQQGYGRGGRMRMEKDKIEILSGMRGGKTIGSPVHFVLYNKDWKNWADIMNVENAAPGRELTRPRPGHADLAGGLKYDFNDLRNVLERSSARETAMRVAIGAFAKQLLSMFNIRIFSHVVQIGHIKVNESEIADILRGDEINSLADNSQVRCLHGETEAQMVELIRETKKKGDTLGGIIQLVIRNVPPGLGSYVHWDRKLDSRLAAALISIQAAKGIQIGQGFMAADRPGSQFHDEIYYDDDQKRFYRKTNTSGGIEGGMSTGEDIVIYLMKKPIPTLMKPLHSVDYHTKEPFEAHKERSDITAVPAFGVIAENVAAPIIANTILEKFGSDTLNDIKQSYEHYLNRIKK